MFGTNRGKRRSRSSRGSVSCRWGVGGVEAGGCQNMSRTIRTRINGGVRTHPVQAALRSGAEVAVQGVEALPEGGLVDGGVQHLQRQRVAPGVLAVVQLRRPAAPSAGAGGGRVGTRDNRGGGGGSPEGATLSCCRRAGRRRREPPPRGRTEAAPGGRGSWGGPSGPGAVAAAAGSLRRTGAGRKRMAGRRRAAGKILERWRTGGTEPCRFCGGGEEPTRSRNLPEKEALTRLEEVT